MWRSSAWGCFWKICPFQSRTMSRNGWLHVKVGFLSVSRLILCYCWEYKILTVLQAVMIEASPLLLCQSFQEDLSVEAKIAEHLLKPLSPCISVCSGDALVVQIPCVVITATLPKKPFKKIIPWPIHGIILLTSDLQLKCRRLFLLCLQTLEIYWTHILGYIF